MLIKLAWRNLFRNPRRTVLSGLAIGLGLAALIFSDALILGMMENMIRTATATFPGQAQIHHAGFLKTFDVENTVAQAQQVQARLGQDPVIKAYAPRTLSFGMLTSTSDVASIMLYGIDPEKERQVSRAAEALEAGSFLGESGDGRILLGKILAKNLGLGLGDRVVVTVGQAGTGNLSQEMFRVGGILRFNTREMDSGMAFIGLKKSQQLLRLDNRVHEIALDFTNIHLASDPQLAFWKTYSQHGNEALGWEKLFPDLAAMVSITDFSLLVMAFILFGIVAFGIMNTLFMSLYERMFEFGVMRAIGTRPFQMGLLIVYEAAALALLSLVIGVGLGWGITAYFGVVGIDYRGLEFTGVTIQDMIYPVVTISQYIIYPIGLFVFTVLVGVYPAVYAARMTPARAMKRTL